MSTAPPPAYDLAALLRPVSAERPSGESLRYEGTYDRIREARREDDPRLSRGIYETELKRADWASVEAACLEALATRTKDLQVAAWLLEAWLHRYGFAGVREGLRLLAGLCEIFWDDLHPRLDEDGGAEAARALCRRSDSRDLDVGEPIGRTAFAFDDAALDPVADSEREIGGGADADGFRPPAEHL